MHNVIAKPWLSLQCRMIPGVRTAVFASDVMPSGEFATLETWPDGAETPAHVLAMIRAAMDSESVSAREIAGRGDAEQQTRWVIACPLKRGEVVRGAVAAEVGGLDATQVPVVTQLMEWGCAWPTFLADQAQMRDAGPEVGAQDAIAAILGPEDFRTAVAAAATALAEATGTRRAAIGIPDRAGVRLAGLSGRAVFDERSDRLRRLQAAMNEACDQDGTVTWPRIESTSDKVAEAHVRLADVIDDTCICTVPLTFRGRPGGAITLMRAHDRPFEADEIERIEQLAKRLGPVLAARIQSDRGGFARLAQKAGDTARRLLGPAHLRLKLVALASALVTGVLVFGTGTYRIPATAVLEGTVERNLVAPADGFVAEALVRAGARVEEGQLLATLDDQPLRLELQRLQSQRDELSNQYDRALGALDHGATRVLQAQIAQAEMRLALVQSELDRLRIVAPFDGLVVSGDLSQSLGSPVTRGESLFRLAPLDDYRVVVQVRESDVADVGPGTTGRLTLAALPGARFDVTVDRVNGMARSIDGRNVLEVEATLAAESGHLRPGMKGLARLEAGERRLLWIWTHRLVDRLRHWWWAYSPLA